MAYCSKCRGEHVQGHRTLDNVIGAYEQTTRVQDRLNQMATWQIYTRDGSYYGDVRARSAREALKKVRRGGPERFPSQEPKTAVRVREYPDTWQGKD